MAEFEPTLRAMTVELLQPYIAAGGGDICHEFTHLFPGRVLAPFFHMTEELSQKIREVTVRYERAVQDFIDEDIKATSLELYEIANQIIQLRKADKMSPEDDLVAALLNATYEGEPLPEAMILGTIRQLIVVGMIAPSVFIGTMARHLADHPEIQDQLRADPSLFPAATEEYLRLFTPYRGFARTANRDVEIGGRLIKKDEPIALLYASANRDEDVFPQGDQFILNRPNIGRHIAFGLGPHQCAGAPLGRLMLRVVLEELVLRTRSIEPDGEVKMTLWPEFGTASVPLKVAAA
jgi:cytochrome P450